jgi:hypothetical protein
LARKQSGFEWPGIVRTFQISRPQSGGFCCIRLRQIGTHHNSDHFLAIAAFELFGELGIRTPIPQ